MRLLLLPLALLVAAPASAATRQWTVATFDRVRVAGPYSVSIAIGSAMARAEGTQAALDAVTVELQSGTLVVRPARPTTGGSGDWGEVTVEIATPTLRGVTLAGSGTVHVGAVKAEDFSLAITGSGDAELERLAAGHASLVLAGSGRLRAAGRAESLDAELQGSGVLDAAALEAGDATVTLSGSGHLAARAARTARVTALGAGDVIVAGPARCTVRSGGSARVACGSDQQQR